MRKTFQVGFALATGVVALSQHLGVPGGMGSISGTTTIDGLGMAGKVAAVVDSSQVVLPDADGKKNTIHIASTGGRGAGRYS